MHTIQPTFDGMPLHLRALFMSLPRADVSGRPALQADTEPCPADLATPDPRVSCVCIGDSTALQSRRDGCVLQ